MPPRDSLLQSSQGPRREEAPKNKQETLKHQEGAQKQKIANTIQCHPLNCQITMIVMNSEILYFKCQSSDAIFNCQIVKNHVLSKC